MEDKLYLCTHCKKFKTKDQFNKNIRNLDRDGISKQCKACRKENYKRLKQEEDNSKRLVNLLKIRLHDAIVRSKKKNLYIDIDLEFLKELWNKQNGKCALTNFDMDCKITSKKENPYVLSLDRKDPAKGYTKDNVQLVCYSANVMKSTLSISELKKFCKAIINNYNYD